MDFSLCFPCFPGSDEANQRMLEAVDGPAVLHAVPQSKDEFFFQRGQELQSRGDFDSAITHFIKAVELNGGNPSYFYHLAYCLQEVAPEAGADENVYQDRAMGNYRKVLDIDPRHHESWYNLGYIQEERGDLEDAVESFKKSLEIVPKDKDALVNLGNCYMALLEYDSSIATYVEAISLEPECVLAHYNLASAHHSASIAIAESPSKTRHVQLAVKAFLETIRLKPDYADAHFNLGICYQDSEKYSSARECYSTALKYAPDFTEAAEALKSLDGLLS